MRASDGSAKTLAMTLWRKQAEAEVQEGAVVLVGGATRKWDAFKSQGALQLGEGGVVFHDFDSVQAHDMLEWFWSFNESSDVELAEGVEVDVEEGEE